MRIKKIIFIALSIVILHIGKSNSQDAEKVFSKSVSSIGLITDYDGLGSGFFINSNTFITNRHVTNAINLKRAIIKLKDGREIKPIKKLFENSKCDLAAIRTGEVANFLSLGDENNLKTGEKVYAIGNPTSNFNIYEFTLTEGIINNITNEKIPVPEYPISAHIILHSATLNKGNSGGPLLNSKGEVIGINSYFYISGNNQFIAIHISELILLLNNYKIDYNQQQGLQNNIKNEVTDTLNRFDKKVTEMIPKSQFDTAQTIKILNDKKDKTPLIFLVVLGILFIFLAIVLSKSGRKQNELRYLNQSIQPQEPIDTNRNILNKNFEVEKFIDSSKCAVFYNGKNYKILTQEILIGRIEDCDIVIQDTVVSKHHCKISKIKDVFYLTDLNSKNGTQLNGFNIKSAILKDKDIIKIGKNELIFIKYT